MKDSNVGWMAYIYVQDIQNDLHLPDSSFSFYLQLPSAMKAYAVPWTVRLPSHPLYNTLQHRANSKGLEARIYSLLNKAQYKPLSLDSICRANIQLPAAGLNWQLIWNNVLILSLNPSQHLLQICA